MKGWQKGLLVALLVGALLSPFASSSPDGLERVAEDKGFLAKGEGKNLISAPVPDYLLPGISNERIATAGAGVLGTAVVFAAMYGLAALLGKTAPRSK